MVRPTLGMSIMEMAAAGNAQLKLDSHVQP